MNPSNVPGAELRLPGKAEDAPDSSPGNLLRLLPDDAAQREIVHNEVHARPTVAIPLPSLVVYIALLNENVTRDQEWLHLRLLPGLGELEVERLSGNFLSLHFDGFSVTWERHTEFTRYTIVQPLAQSVSLAASAPDLMSALRVAPEWLRALPGQTIAAMKLAFLHGDLTNPAGCLEQSLAWFGEHPVVASVMGASGHSLVVTDLTLRPSGFEHMLVVASPETSTARAGRVTRRVLELETYRILSLRGLSAAKNLWPMLSEADGTLTDVMARLENKLTSDQDLLDTLVAMAARVERATTEHEYCFSATSAYHALVLQRSAELREQAIPGTQTLGNFMQRRLAPAIATVVATEQRLASLSERVTRASALLRTRVDIAAEAQNQQLLEKLTRGQALQLRLQATVEGLSIAAISYYVVSLLFYGAKSLEAAGAAINPEIAVGVSIPLVLAAVWWVTRRIHRKLRSGL
ncbi:MAG: DUF3422 domain-containing protein [Lysobacteraceae bacterium]|nr:MAG: DUF3422 domain-containing protein [Xanthomonadaceae bacterium]